MPASCGISAPWRNLPSGITSASLPPSAAQSRRASSSSLSDCDNHSERMPPLEAVVEDDGGDLATFAAAGAVTQHPAAPKAHRRRRRFTAIRRAGIILGAGIGIHAVIVAMVFVPGVGALDGLPVRGDAVTGIEPAAVGFACEDHAFKLGV